ncbi:hypothetical protein ACEPPN_000540 [Leptodophora sp. 'Broadleaf-Isolate-01']
MQFLTLGLLAASAALSTAAYNRYRGVGSHSKSWSWIKYFDNLVTFGDRLLYQSQWHGTSGRITTTGKHIYSRGGITWGRWVSNYTGAKLYSYAVSGAVCDNNIIYRYLSAIHGPLPDVVYEVDAFTDTKFVNATTKKNSLYTDRHEDNTVLNSDGTTIPDYIDCIFKRFDEIYKNGGRYFVLMNTAPLELPPLYGVPGKGGLAASHYWQHKMKEYTYLVNSVSSYRTPYELLIAKRYPGASFAVFDVHSLITGIYNNPSKYLASPANVTGQYYVCDVATGSKCTSSSLSLDHYLWYDELHPSEKTDQVIAKEFAKVVNGSSTLATYW